MTFGDMATMFGGMVAVGGVKLGYACMASRAGLLMGAKANQGVHIVAGSVMIAVGVYLVVKA